jgi:hypothetical protein
MSDVPVIKPEWLLGITMTQAQKDQWLNALRSGEYKQGRGRLCRPQFDEFCCLGVAKDQGMAKAISAYYIDSGFIPRELQDQLAQLNDYGLNDDGKPWNFEQIADYIEAAIPACDAVKQ